MDTASSPPDNVQRLADPVNPKLNSFFSRKATVRGTTPPDPDLMIRTAGEMRWSNFLIWQAAYTELYVTDVAWPEFGEKELLDAVLTYQQRTRKFGSVVE